MFQILIFILDYIFQTLIPLKQVSWRDIQDKTKILIQPSPDLTYVIR